MFQVPLKTDTHNVTPLGKVYRITSYIYAVLFQIQIRTNYRYKQSNSILHLCR